MGSIQTQLTLAAQLADSTMLPAHYRKQPANLLWALRYAESIGVPDMTAITGIYVVDGKPTASADLIAGLVRRAGHKLRITGNDKSATAQVIRADDPEFQGFVCTWDWDRARQAGLAGKSVWKSYPAAMLRARAITEVARMACSEALHGVIYTPEELGATVTEDGEVLAMPATVQVAAPPPAQPAQPAALPPPPKAEAPGWADDSDRRWFMGEIGHRGLDYDAELAPWCESIGRPRPSAMTPTQRRALLAAIATPDAGAGARLAAWLADKRAKDAAPPADDRPFFDDEVPDGQ